MTYLKYWIGVTAALFAIPAAFAQSLTYSSQSGKVEFRATGHPSALHVVGKGAGPQGTLIVNRTQVSGSLSFELTSLNTGISLRDEHMKDKYLQVGKYPDAQLTITKMTLPQALTSAFPGASGIPFQGLLELHGVRKPVSGTVNVTEGAAHVLQMTASFGLKLTDFGIEIPKFMGITIADNVQVTVQANPQVSF